MDWGITSREESADVIAGGIGLLTVGLFYLIYAGTQSVKFSWQEHPEIILNIEK
jgi:hypothetical protein